MKKLILSLLAAGFAVTSFAKGGMMEPGSILLYGVGSYSSQHGTTTNKFGAQNNFVTDNDRVRNWQIAPGIGFNLTSNLALGVDGYWGGSRTTMDRKLVGMFPGIDRVRTYEYGVGPFVRYTQPISEHFFAFGQFTAHYLKGRLTNRFVTAISGGNSWVADDNYKGFDVSFVPAVGAMISRSWGLTFSVGGVSYQYTKADYSPVNYAYYNGGIVTPGNNHESKDNQFNITFGQQFNLGIQKYIGVGRRNHHRAEPMDDTRHMDTSDDESEDNSRRRNRRNDDE